MRPAFRHHRVSVPLIALLALGGAGGVRAQELDGAATGEDVALVAALRDREQRMTIPVTIAGEGPFRFVVDTGAQATVIARDILPRLGLLPSGKATLVAVGSTRPVETVELDGLAFAGREFNGLVAPLLDGYNIGADGIIGLDSLQDLRVILDFRSDTLAVTEVPDRGGSDGYEIIVRARAKKGQMIITSAHLDGVRTAVIIDTGSQVSIGNRALQSRLRKRIHTLVTSRDVNGSTVESELGYASSLEIGRLTMADIPIAFADSPAFAAMGLTRAPAVILGIRNLRLFDRVAIDFSNRRVLFDLPPGTR